MFLYFHQIVYYFYDHGLSQIGGRAPPFCNCQRSRTRQYLAVRQVSGLSVPPKKSPRGHIPPDPQDFNTDAWRRLPSNLGTAPLRCFARAGGVGRGFAFRPNLTPSQITKKVLIAGSRCPSPASCRFSLRLRSSSTAPAASSPLTPTARRPASPLRWPEQTPPAETIIHTCAK